MKRWSLVCLAVIAVALIPGGSAVYASGGSPGEIDIVRAELAGTLSGNGEINVFGTLRCTGVGPLILDVLVQQSYTSGTGAGGTNTGYACITPGETIKWVLTAQGGPWKVDKDVTVTITAVGPTDPIKTEKKVLHWGLHAGI